MKQLLLLCLCCLLTPYVWAINILPPTVQPERETMWQPPDIEPYSPFDLLIIIAPNELNIITQIDIQAPNLELETFLFQMIEPILNKSIDLSQLEKVLLLMNDLPGLNVSAILEGNHLMIEAAQTPYEIVAHTDNRGTVYTGPTQYLADVIINNPGGYISQTILEGTIANPANEMSAASLTHTKPFGTSGTYGQGLLNYSQVHPGYTLSTLNSHGYSASLELSVTQPLIRKPLYNLYAWMGYDILDSKTNSEETLLYFDKVESIRAGLMYDITDRWLGTNYLTTSISRGVDLFTGDNKPHLERSRYFGTKNYTKMNASMTRQQVLPGHFGLYLSIMAQYATNPVLASEQYGVGGEDFGLAYDYYEIAGDSGYSGRIELNRTFLTHLWLVNFFQPYISYDGGEIFQKDADIHQSLTSLGGGLRFNVTDFISGQLEVAKPLTRKVAATDSYDARGFFYFTAQF